jgi:chitinase
MTRKITALLIMTIALCSCAPKQKIAPVQIESQPPKLIIRPPVEAKPRPEANPPAMSFIHGCYVYAHKLQSRRMLEQIRFDQFNVLYLIAAPKWTAADFAGTGSIAFNKYVTNDIYPAGDTGMALAPAFIDLAHQNKVRVLLCLQDREFLAVAANPQKQKNFIATMTALVKKYGYDGIEVDWEEDFDMALHAELMSNFRRRLNVLGSESSPAKHYYLATAILAGKQYKPAIAASLSRSADWINVMTYDLGGALYGNTPSHNASLSRVKKYLANWSVFDSSKICVGLAGYGYLYQGITPGRKSAVPLRQIGRSVYYNQLSSLLSVGWKESYDAAAEASYYISPDGRSFATLDDNRSIDRKMDWILTRRYRGVFWWEFHCDAIMPTSDDAQIRHSLIDPVESRIRAASVSHQSYGVVP